MLSIILLGAALRWPLWTTFRFREDEALYGYWAWLIYSRIDVMLQTATVDKPPLFPYLLAHLYTFFTPSEMAARLPNLVASTLALPLLYAWTRHLFDRETAWRAMLLYTVMPLAVLMAPTAYMDALMVGFCLLAAWAATRRGARAWAWAAGSGLALGLGVVTKPLALLWWPLVWGTLLSQRKGRMARALAWSAGFGYVMWRWWQWERLRDRIPTWEMALVNYGGIAWLPPTHWTRRALSWLEVMAEAWGGWGILVTLAGLAIFGLHKTMRRDSSHSSTSRLFLGMWMWAISTVSLYVVTTLSVWDRYLLTLVPVWAILAAWGWRTARASAFRTRVVHLLWVGWLLWVGVQSGRAAYPVGGDHGAYDGIDAVAAYLSAELPRGGIVYHRWLGWHYGFYLFAAPYDYRWWSDVEWLAEDAAREKAPRAIVFPAWREQERQAVLNAFARHGVQMRLVARVPARNGSLRFWVYRISVSKPSTSSERGGVP